MTRRRAWQRLAPTCTAGGGPLPLIEEYLAEASTGAALAELESARAYPRSVIAELHRRGLAELFVPELATTPALGALNALTATHSGSLAITVGVNGLALLPVYIAGTQQQRELVAARLRAGAFAAILLTELDHGSNLLRNEATARSDGEGYLLDGTKHLINGGSEHTLLVALLRTRTTTVDIDPLGRLRDFTLFLVERDHSVQSLPRRHTLPVRSADISGVRLAGTRVPASAVLGAKGDGFAIVQKTLMISHGAIGALASGAVSGAVETAVAYARRRNVYGEPIARLGAITEHLTRLVVLDVVVAALAVKAVFATNWLGPGAAYLTAAAKYACCRMGEEAVSEGRYVMGAAALFEDLPYARFVRDILLYGVFDGTSHLMLDELSRQRFRSAGASASPTIPATRDLYDTPPVPIVRSARQRWRPYPPALHHRCRDLAEASGSDAVAALAELAGALGQITQAAVTASVWDGDQAFRFEAAAVLAELEALLAACELAVPACRAVLGIPGQVGEDDAAAAEYAVSWLGGRVALRVRELGQAVGLPDGDWAVAVLRRLPCREGPRNRLHAQIIDDT